MPFISIDALDHPTRRDSVVPIHPEDRAMLGIERECVQVGTGSDRPFTGDLAGPTPFPPPKHCRDSILPIDVENVNFVIRSCGGSQRSVIAGAVGRSMADRF